MKVSYFPRKSGACAVSVYQAAPSFEEGLGTRLRNVSLELQLSQSCTRMTFQCRVAWTVNSLPSSPLGALRYASSMYPNIRVLLSILCTLPVTTCSAERSFSGLKRTKTTLRSSMSGARLSELSFLAVHRDLALDIPKAIDEFARRHPRRMQWSSVTY